MPDEVLGETPNPAPEGETPEAPKQQTPEQLAAELEKTRTALKAANKEAAERRKRLEALETAETERKAAEMTETQKLQAKLDRAEAEMKSALERAANSTKRAAIVSKAGAFIDAEDVVTALAGKLELNDAGEVDGLDAALKDLAKAKPHWLKTEKGAPKLNAGNPGNGNSQGETEAQQRARVYGTGANQLFTPGFANQNGGGVIMDPQSPKQQPKE